MEKHSESSDLKLLNISRTDKIYSIEEIAKLSKKILKKYNFKKVYIFGSYARGEATKYSDIDIMIFGGNLNYCT